MSFYKRFIFVLGCSLLPILTQAQIDTLFRYNADERIFKLWQKPCWDAFWNASHLTAKDTTRVITELNRLQSFAQQKDDERLYWYVDLHKILFRHNLLDFDHKPSLVLDAAESHMDQCPVPVVRAAYWHFLGRYHFGKLRFDKGFRWLLRAQQEFERIGYQNIPEINKYLVGLGGRYYYFEEYKTCIQYMEQAFRYPFLSERAEVAALHNTGMTYQQLKVYTKAELLFSQSITKAKQYHDTTYVGVASTGYGHNLLLQGQVQKALPYLYTGFAYSLKEAPENSAVTALHLAKALLTLDSVAKAKYYIDRSIRFSSPNKAWVNYFSLYYQTQALYYKKAGIYHQATLYLDSALRLKDSLRAVFSNQLLANSRIKTNAERYVSKIQQVEAEKTNAILVRNIIIVALILLTAAGVYALNQNQLKREQEKRLQAEQQKRADELLAHATAQLDQYMSHLKEKNELIEKINADLAQVTESTYAADANQINPLPAIDNLIQRVILTEVDWQQFKHLFEQVYPGFFHNLQEHYPELTPAEIRLLALSKLAIPGKDMAFMLGVTQESIRKSRYRLRKRLEQLRPDTTLEQLLRDM